jgi:hypothetical protein
LTLAAKRAAAAADFLANGTMLTGTPPSSLSSRLAAATSAALLAAGKSGAAAIVNATAMVPTAVVTVGSATVDISNQVASGVGAANGVAAGSSQTAFALNESLGSGVAFGAVTAAIMYYFLKGMHRAQTTTKLIAGKEIENPLYKHPKPSPPSGKPPRHAFKPFHPV